MPTGPAELTCIQCNHQRLGPFTGSNFFPAPAIAINLAVPGIAAQGAAPCQVLAGQGQSRALAVHSLAAAGRRHEVHAPGWMRLEPIQAGLMRL